MFTDDELTDDKFLCGKLNLLQPARGYRAATDPVLLAAACPAQAGESVLDLGCGAGAAILCLGRRVSGTRLYGLELQPGYAALARRNAFRNRLDLEVAEGDLRAMPEALKRGFDHVICNPPYYPPGGTHSPLETRAIAMHIEAVALSDWMEAASRRLRVGGWLTLIAGADAVPELLSGLGKLGSPELLPLSAREGRAAKRVILRARKGGRAPFRLLPPFVLHHGPSHEGDRESYTPAANEILRNGGTLSAAFG